MSQLQSGAYCRERFPNGALKVLLVAWQATNIMAHTVDIKIQFEQTDMVPGPKGRVFRRNLLVHGGKSDDRGFSHADCFLRRDEGAVVGPHASLQLAR